MTDTGPSEIRVSDAERELTLRQLRDAAVEGRIDPAEFDRRADLALQARTADDLAAITADLPDQAGDKELELRGVFSSVKRNGNWVVPRVLRLNRRMGSAELDFTQADIRFPVVRIEADMIGCSVEMRVPEGASVSLDEVSVTLGSVQDHRKEAPAQGTPHFEVVGQVRFGSVEVRGPKRKLFDR